METWPLEVIRALNRSKFGRDETKKYELIVYKPIEAILQEGPQCGIVALAMAMNIKSCNTTVHNLMEKAKELLYTIQGELFDARVIPNLCQHFNLTATLHRWITMTDLVECLKSHHVCLVPYDSDANHEPCLKKGHRAHWLLVHGYLKEITSSISNEYDLVLVQHGKSKFLGAFSLLDLFQSNGQLIEADPKRRSESDYCVPQGGSLQETFCMALFEGSLSKWTNVLQGWQYRFFVLDPAQGMLIYYTSKENMVKGDRRGVVLLKGANLGIDSEDDSTFTIRSHGKTFHLQARDAEERQKWLCNLEDAISFNTVNTDNLSHSNSTLFHRKILEADGFLQLLIEQVNELEEVSNQLQDLQKQQCYKRVVLSAKRLTEAVKYSIVSLQLAKLHMDPHAEDKPDVDCPAAPTHMNINQDEILHSNETSSNTTEPTIRSDTDETTNQDDTPFESLDFHTAVKTVRKKFPISSYSSSDDDNDFYDADETMDASVFSPPSLDETKIDETPRTTNSEIPFETYDAAYEEAPEEDLAPMDGTIISHLISQARISMDLTKITLPTFILERRSFLEMLADFLAHPDEFVKITDHQTPRDRFIQVVKWYLSAFHAGRKSPVPKKPYNPILGEIFQCVYDIGPSSSTNTTTTKDGPIPWASDNNVTFIAEQTSHHPPIATFYAECPAKNIQIDGCLWTKSKFLGLSVAVHMIGDATLTLLDYDERYVITFPSAYGRSILGVPWFEMGGKISIDCEKTGYSAVIEFLTKPFYSGKKHQISGILYGPDKREFCKIDGEWNGVMNAKYSDTKVSEVFFDTKNTAVIKKIVRPIAEQDEHESRRMWKDVTYYLKSKQIDKATGAKSFLEQRQREEAKERAEKSLKWQTKYFTESGEQKWTYENKLSKRLEQQSEFKN